MRYSNLKKIRTAVSLLFFFSVLLIYIDISGIIPAGLINTITFLQFIPSLLSFLGGAGLAASGFIIIITITLLSGRIYCSSVCPLGTLQDAVIYLGRKLRKKRSFKFFPSYKVLRYVVLSIALILFITGNILILSFLDPYSNTGRIFASMIKPAVIFFNNLGGLILETFNIYSIYPRNLRGYSIPGLIYTSLFIFIIITLSLKKERLFCNTMCPAGAILGLISRFSLIKIDLEKDSCTGCGLCEKVCKANCIDKKEKMIDFERCVSCYNCFTECPNDGIIFKWQGWRLGNRPHRALKKETLYSKSKRDFVRDTGIYFLGLTGLSYAQNKIIPKKDSKFPENRKYPVSPPGGVSTEHYNTYCTSCHLCVSVCPTGVLQPSFLEYGFTGMLQPRMDFARSFCNYECSLCLDVCPTDAITKLPLETKKFVQIGKARFIKDNCIVETEKKDCGACSEHCPTKAVQLIRVQGADLMLPEVKDEYCIGCGACEFACPTKPYKAIFVEGNQVHKTAKKKSTEKNEQKINYKEEFPF